MAFEAKRRLSRHREGNTTRGPKRANNDIVIRPKDGKSDLEEDSNWSGSVDEEVYIVFCFGEDGSFQVLEDGKPDETSSNRVDSMSRTNSRPVNRKLNYEENTYEEKFTGKTHENNLPNSSNRIRSHQKEAEEENIYLEAESESGANFESSDSTESSDASAGSFAFPVLGREWIGSPERMPKSKGLRLRKHKARCIGILCFRF